MTYSWGPKGNKMYATGGDRTKRMYEDQGQEDRRQAEWDRTHVRADGQHYVFPESTLSLEQGEIAYEAHQREYKQKTRWVDTKGFLSMCKALFFQTEMYSSDPHMARIGMAVTAQSELGAQREMAARAQQSQQERDDAIRAEERAIHQRERAEDKAGEEARMKMLAQAMFDEAERRRSA